MSKRRVLVCLLFAVVFVGGTSYAAVSADRIMGDLSSGPKMPLRGNMHGLARPEFDLGRADASHPMQGVSLAFRPSPAQQQDLDRFLAELGDRNSPNYHKYLTPAQFGERFGLSLGDIAKVSTWLHNQGFTNIRVANGRNQISFDGTVGQIESVFDVEMHNYAVEGVVHLANAGEPSIPAALSGIVLGVGSLNDFAPKPRAKIHPHLTSYVSGNHFLTPGDFAVIYDVSALYTAGADGSGQTIAVVGQSAVSMTDLNNFRTNSSLSTPANVTMTLVPSTSKSTKCPGDEGESDLDLEWSEGIAKNAKIVFVYAGLTGTETCSGSRANNVWTALQYAVDNKVAPFISTSYGFCESGLGSSFANQVRGWAQQAQTQGQTIVAASGDSGAADCDTGGSATQGLQVDVPASIPEVTGAGGNEFSGDSAGAVTGTAPNTTAAADPPYWSASGTGSDTVVTALQYIPEIAWNDTAQSNTGTNPLFSASGGGVSTFFSKPTWQTGAGTMRAVPDISVNASNGHDPYLVCSEDGDSTPCASGFRDSAGGNFFAVGGTSASAPTFTAILALVNQYIGNTGVAPINPTLYSLAASQPSIFHDVTSGNNDVPCTSGTTNCPSGTTQIGFNAGPGYDQVTGLGSVDAFALAQALSPFSLAASALSPASVAAGTSTTTTITVTPNNNFTGTVSFSCSNVPAGVSCAFNPTTVAGGSGTTQLTIQTAPNTGKGTIQVTVKGASGTPSAITTLSVAVTATTESFSLVPSPAVSTLSVAQGQTTSVVNLQVKSSSTPSFVMANGSGSTTTVPLTYTCSGLPSESTCNFSGGTGSGQTITTSATAVSFSIATTAPTARLERPFDRLGRIFYAVLFPGLFGVVFLLDSRRRCTATVRMLTLIALLGLSTAWLASCGGTSNSSNSNPGTPKGSYPITINATTGGGAPLSYSLKFTLNVQ